MTSVAQLLKIAAVLTALAATSVGANAQQRARAQVPPSAVQASALPSCPADAGRFRFVRGGGAFNGGRSDTVYGQLFLSGRDASGLGMVPTSGSTRRAPTGGNPSAGTPPSGSPAAGAPPPVTSDRPGGIVQAPPAPSEAEPAADGVPPPAVGAAPPGTSLVGATGPSGLDGNPDGLPGPASDLEPFVAPAVTPEPGTLLLIGTGVGGMLMARRRRRLRGKV
jgi:hypothetical protein